jgi:hypothetical protein
LAVGSSEIVDEIAGLPTGISIAMLLGLIQGSFADVV